MQECCKSRSLIAWPVLAMVFALGCASNPSSYAAKGKKALDAGRYPEAEIEYKKATQAKPAFGEAWYGQGLAEFRQARLPDAYTSLLRATELLPSREDVAVSLADVCVAIYLSEGKQPAQLYQRAAATSAELLKRDPKSFDGNRLKGYIEMIDRHYPEAIDLLRKADGVKPRQGEVVQALMESLIGNSQGPEAEKLANDFLSRNKDFAPVYDTLYAYLMSTHREGDAENLLKSKAAANQTVLQYRLQLARHYLNAGKLAEMHDTLQKIVDDPKTFPDGRMTAGNFCAVNNRLAEALAFFQAGVAQDKAKKVAYQERSAEILVSMGERSQAKVVIEDILKSDSGNVDARALRARMNLDSNQPEAIDAALTELQKLTKERPTDAALHFNLGRAQLAKGNTDIALAEFQEAIRQNPRFLPAKVLAANISMEREDYTTARRYGEDIARLTGGSPGARLLQAAALTGMGNFDEAARQINELNREFPGAPEPKLQMAALDLAEKKYPAAESLYRGLYDANPKDLRSLQGLIDTYEAEGRHDTAIQFLTQQKQKSPSPQIEAMLADTALRGNKLDLAVQEYTQLSNANPKSSFEHLRLGDAYFRKGDLQQAITEFQTAKGLAPKDALASAMLALALHNAGKSEDALKAYRETLALQSGNPLVSNNLAYLMAENGGNLDDALRLAQEALRQQPSNVAIADTVGVIYLKKNLPDSAIQVLSNATQKAPGQAIYRYHLAMALLQKGDKAGARRECESALANRPNKDDETKIRDLLARTA
ncbi:MAG TPA: tetratricopeptide repeat protein [Bryobacteraceae bacterium]|nr:tetratricopeptide repeat protein [Bryobacteraceae bacterium]